MELIPRLLSENVLFALGWTVLHSLWQSFLLALMYSVFLLASQQTDAQKRYSAGIAALSLTLVAAVITFFLMLKKVNSVADDAISVIYLHGGEVVSSFTVDSPAEDGSFFSYFNEHMPVIVTVWMVGVVFFLLKMLGGLLYIQRLKHYYVAPLDRDWQETLGLLANEMGIRRHIRLFESALVKAPMMVGWIKPVILLPIGAVNQLSTEQVEAILAHELAHIARHDYLLNLLQSLVETLFYFNPAVWWISANIRTERENCCDDLAVKVCGNSLTYAKALVSLQEIHQAAPAFAMSFTAPKNQLLHRIQRILQPSKHKSDVMEKLPVTLLLLAAGIAISVHANTPFTEMINRFTSPPEPAPAEELAPGSLVALEDAMAAEDLEYAPAVAPVFEADTLPKGRKGNFYMHRENDGEEVEVVMNDDNIVFLKINGEEIPKDRFAEYDSKIRQMIEDTPEPPLPPLLPTAPAPPAPGFRPLAPVAPIAPVPPVGRGKRIVTTERDKKGNTFIVVETPDGSEPLKIELKEGKNGTVVINGQEIKGLKKGNKTVIIDDSAGEGRAYVDDDHWYFTPGRVELPDMPDMPDFHLAPGDVHLFDLDDELTVLPEMRGRLWMPDMGENFSPEELAEREQWMEELKDRAKNDALNLEWLKEFGEAMGENWRSPRLLELDELNRQLEESRIQLRGQLEEQLRERERLMEEFKHEQMEQFERQRADALRQREEMRKRSRAKMMSNESGPH